MDRQTKIFVLVALAVTVLAVVFVAPFASRAPDGLERVLEDNQVGVDATGSPLAERAPFADYKIPGVEDEWRSIAIAGLAGLVMMLGGSYAIAKMMLRAKRRDEAQTKP